MMFCIGAGLVTAFLPYAIVQFLRLLQATLHPDIDVTKTSWNVDGKPTVHEKTEPSLDLDEMAVNRFLGSGILTIVGVLLLAKGW
jgi:hypothetical protein